MNFITFSILLIAFCSLDFSGVNGHKLTTQSHSVCGNGVTITFPTYVSNQTNVWSSDPHFSKKCRKVIDSLGLRTLCRSGPHYKCMKRSTTAPSAMTPNTTATTIITTTATHPGDNSGCNASLITIGSSTTAETIYTPTTTGTTTTTTGTTPSTAETTPTTTETTSTTNETTPTTTETTPTTTETTPTATETTPTTTEATTTTTETAPTTTATSAPTPGCSYDGQTYSIGTQLADHTSCTYQSCQSNLTWAPVPTTGPCTSPFQNYPPHGCLWITYDNTPFCNARLNCQKEGGDLWTSAYLDSMDNFLSFTGENYLAQNVWIGIYGNSTDFYWLNGTIATDKYNAMKAPYARYEDNNCIIGIYMADPNEDGWWMYGCSFSAATLCERLP